jgi:hypothetical protein
VSDSQSVCRWHAHSQAFKWTNVTSASDCCASCAATSGCKAWEWNSVQAAQNCHLKSEPGPAHYNPDVTCGTTGALPPVPRPPPPPAPLPPAPPAPKGSPNIVWFLTGVSILILFDMVMCMQLACALPFGHGWTRARHAQCFVCATDSFTGRLPAPMQSAQMTRTRNLEEVSRCTGVLGPCQRPRLCLPTRARRLRIGSFTPRELHVIAVSCHQ